VVGGLVDRPQPSPTTLAATKIRLRRHVRPFFGDHPIEAIQPMLIRQWQNQLPSKLGYESLVACRSILLRILQPAEDEGAITANPLRRVPPPKRRIDPEKVLGQAKRRAYTPEEAGRLLAFCPLFWWDHVLALLGTGLRFGEFAGLRRRRVHLERTPAVLQVVDVRYQAGRFGSGFKPRPKSDAGIRELPLAPLVVEAIRGQLPPGADPKTLVFAGPGGGDHVAAGSRTVLSRHGVRRMYQTAVKRAELDHLDLRGPLSVFRRADLRFQVTQQHGGVQRLGDGVGEARQRLHVPVGEHFGGLTSRASVTAHHQHAEAELLVNQRDQDKGLSPASGDTGERSTDPVGVLDQPDTGPEQLPHDVAAVVDAHLPLVWGEPDLTRHLHDALAVVEQEHDDVGVHPLGDLGRRDLGQLALVELG
jgi:integrase